MNLNYLEKKIKINFKNKDLLIRSLTHKSFDSNNNNEIRVRLQPDETLLES